MSAEAFFALVVGVLERTRIPYMVTGSFASSAHGEVRGTRDIDIVIAQTAEQLRALVAEFPDDRYYADEIDALEALQHHSQFNIIDFGSSWKVDLIIRKPRDFSRVEFERRRPHVINGTCRDFEPPLGSATLPCHHCRNTPGRDIMQDNTSFVPRGAVAFFVSLIAFYGAFWLLLMFVMVSRG